MEAVFLCSERAFPCDLEAVIPKDFPGTSLRNPH